MAKGYSLDALVNEHYMKSRTNLDNTKLDTLTGMDSVGVYYQSYNAYATTSNNYPAGAQAGTLEVLPHSANILGRVMQRYTTYSSMRCWVRSQRYASDDESFGSWVELINVNNIYNAIYPIGIVLQFDNATNPNNMFTGTVWEQIVDGRSARAATGPQAGTTAGQIGSVAGSDTATIAVANLPGHTHGMQNHTHSIAAHSHTMAHTHSINHDHGAVSTNTTGGHTHSLSGTANAAGEHTHPISQGDNANVRNGRVASSNSAQTHVGSTNGAGNHTHSISGTANSAGNHAHTVDLPNFTGTSGGSSAGSTGGTALTTGGPSNNTTTSTGDGTALNVCNSVHYYAFWKRVA
ncbi:tail fiber protein [Escherichia phage ST32]|uniref:Tail fiber protein n=1 Tax=Escherichia phage ST32 TaxID=2005048 RepID=A0A218MAQ1_9CAUD|nr:tail fiber protein [Escherichia phage ST32]ASD54032.2 tail fiber protein [Escherichia phage ST32]